MGIVDKLFEDEVSGVISIPCCDHEVILWKGSKKYKTIGSVSVFYRAGNSKELELIVRKRNGDEQRITIPPENTRSITFDSVDTIGILGKGTSGICYGKYCIRYHVFKKKQTQSIDHHDKRELLQINDSMQNINLQQQPPLLRRRSMLYDE